MKNVSRMRIKIPMEVPEILNSDEMFKQFKLSIEYDFPDSQRKRSRIPQNSLFILSDVKEFYEIFYIENTRYSWLERFSFFFPKLDALKDEYFPLSYIDRYFDWMSQSGEEECRANLLVLWNNLECVVGCTPKDKMWRVKEGRMQMVRNEGKNSTLIRI
jgi:hypothetical protein